MKKKKTVSGKSTAKVKKKAPAAKKKAASGKKAIPLKKKEPARNRAEKALRAAMAALEKKALDLEILDISDLVYYTDYFVICSGTSTQHVAAIADNVENVARKMGDVPSGIEGKRNSLWVLIDLGDVVVHVFEQETRQFYQLEKLWLDAPRVEYAEFEAKTRKAG